VYVPYSKLKASIASKLFAEGFIASYAKKTRKQGDVLEIGVAYRTDMLPRISDVKRISKPSRRLYVSVSDIKPVRSGQGLMVLSTPKGILTGHEARKEHVGGEFLFSIW